jgi:protein PhnA
MRVHPQEAPEHIEGNSDKIKGLVLKTIYLRKS